MEKHKVEINGTEINVVSTKKLDKTEFISDLAKKKKKMNGNDVKVADCIYTGKKKYHKEIKWNEKGQ